jgi:hypothetical protein
MNSKEKLQASLNHRSHEGITVDFGATPVTGVHVLAIERLRQYYGLEKRTVKVSEPYQMLGYIDDDLAEIMCCDVMGIAPRKNMFGIENNNWKEFKTFWGQEVLVPGDFNTTRSPNGDLLVFPEGDTSVLPSARMPGSGYFFDTIDRHQPYDEENPDINDNLEEFSLLSETDIAYWKTKSVEIKNSNRGIIVNLGGTALGDIALVPGPWMKNPKGIRDISDWYMSTLMRMDFVKEIFERQSNIAVKNLETLYNIVGNSVDAVFMCGTDFGTQNSQFCSAEIFSDLYTPYYRKMNDWIHKHTSWKTFKHSCGAIMPLIPGIIESGFDIINPVQINATDMDSQILKDKFGDKITFWGGGVDTQKVLSFGNPADVEKQVSTQCEILGKNGGFVFNTVHNTQANVPVENLAAMIGVLRKFNGKD